MVKYSFLETGHVFLILDDEKITIKSSDPRCLPLKELLTANPENPNKEEIWKIVDPLKNVSTKHLSKINGSSFIKEVKLPVAVENLFKSNYQNTMQNKRLYNALLTEVNLGKNDLLKILEKSSTGVAENKIVISDDNGLIIFIDRYIHSWNKDSFFNINTIPDFLKNKLLKDFSGDLPSLLLNYGFDIKFIPKFLTYLKEKKGDSEKFPWVTIYLYKILSKVLDQQNLHKFLLNKEFEYYFTMSNHWESYYFQEEKVLSFITFLKEKLMLLYAKYLTILITKRLFIRLLIKLEAVIIHQLLIFQSPQRLVPKVKLFLNTEKLEIKFEIKLK
jgi:hypothetical protein